LVAGAQKIFHGQLERKKWILELMRQAPRQLAPSRYALRLNQSLTLVEQVSRHAVE
jgi:hypothetical protein